jgi:hypothetical protein
MADGRGGYRRPTKPAAASGPGRLSKRTDGRQPSMTLPDAKYGEQQAFQNAQQAAPMAESAGGMGAPSAAPAGPNPSNVVPFGAPTQNPDQPVTAGLPMGPGAGSTASPVQPTLTPQQVTRLKPYIPTLVLLASADDADPATKQFVRQLRAELG